MSEKLKGIVSTGDFCEIHLLKSRNEVRTYQSKVEFIESSEVIYVYIPTFKTKMVKLPIDGNYEVLFKSDKAIYKYEMKISGYARLDGELFMKIKLTSSGEKVQRRRYYRLDVTQSLYLKLPKGEEDEEESDKIINTEIRDISAGGMRFVAVNEFEQKKDIVAYFRLGTDFYAIRTQIINERDISEFSERFRVEYRAEFVNVSKYDREKLVSHIFEEQRNKLGKTTGR